MKKAFLFLLLLSLAIIAGVPAQTSTPTLIIFSGSDWCLPCIRLEKEVFSKSEFTRFADQHLEVIRADFPQKTSLEPEIVRRNETLADQYNPDGYFPRICLIAGEDQNPVYLPEAIESPAHLISLIKPYLNTNKVYRRQAILMGSAFEFAIVHNNANEAETLLDQCIEETTRLEGILSEWRDSSEVSEVIRQAGKKPVRVSPEFFDLTLRCIKISEITQGAFDISFRGVNLWKFHGEELVEWPDSQAIKAQVALVGYDQIKLTEPDEIMLMKPGMAIGFGAVGKGYAADRLKEMLMDKGVTGGVINASGDLTTWGTRPDGSPWNVGITNPGFPDDLLFGLQLSDRSIATSGNYEKYFTFQGRRYAHIIDPKTGIPVTDKKSVSVISKSAELSDALATALFVLKTEIAIDLAEQLPGVSCIIIDNEDRVFATNDIELPK